MRITGGLYRSRHLKAPAGAETRPTADRVREALFAILGGPRGLEGARVLDLYAGTGALGLEALSRGAAHAVFVECGRPALKALTENVTALGAGPRATVIASPVERAGRALATALPDARAAFDLVFADPPYADVTSGAALRAIAGLLTRRSLAPGAQVVVEHARADTPLFSVEQGHRAGAPAGPIAPLALAFRRTYGDTTLSFFTLEDGPFSEEPAPLSSRTPSP